MLSVVMLSAVMLSVIMPNVVAPKNCYLEFSKAKWNGKQTSCTIKLFTIINFDEKMHIERVTCSTARVSFYMGQKARVF
jgi:hypothetical protein